MYRFISTPFKHTLKRLHIGEHFNFYHVAIILSLENQVNDFPAVRGIFNVLKSTFAVEDNLYKLSQASILTEDIVRLNGTRSAYFIFLWRCVDIAEYVETSASRPAMALLRFLHHSYKDIPEMNYYEMSGAMLKFLKDCEASPYREAFELVGSTAHIDFPYFINQLKTTDDTFNTLYEERALSKVHVAEMGKLTKIRFEVDDIFYSLVGAVNMSWTANEIGPQDPDVRQKLIAIKETITAAISQAQLLLAHRVKRPKKTKEAEAPADEKAKTEGVEVGK